MKLNRSQNDKTFLSALEAGQFSVQDFDHRAHVRLAYLVLFELNVLEATQKVKQILFALLKQAGVTPEEKYHETMTGAWLMAVKHFMMHSESAGQNVSCADDFIDQFPQLLDTALMLNHYSKERLFSEQARSVFVAPDLLPFPEFEDGF